MYCLPQFQVKLRDENHTGDRSDDDDESVYDPPQDDGQIELDDNDDESVYDPPQDDGQIELDDDDDESVYDPPEDDVESEG